MADTIEGALRAMLLADTGVNAITTNIHSAYDPQATPRPKITYTRVSTSTEVSNDGTLSIRYASMQFDCWSDSGLQARQLAKAVVNAIDSYSGTYAGIVIYSIIYKGGYDPTNQTSDGEQTAPQRSQVTFTVTYLE